MITVKKLIVNPFQENSYLITDGTGECILVDAGFYFQEEREYLIRFIAENKLNPVRLVNTHCHFDHLMGVDFFRHHYGIPFECHQEDAFWLGMASAQARSFGYSMQNVDPADGFLSEKDPLCFGNTTMKIIHVPGHSPGHVAFYSGEGSFLLSGDALFYEGIGRTDLPGGDYAGLICGISDKLLGLPADTVVYSGHGPETSIGHEKMNNPYLI